MGAGCDVDGPDPEQIDSARTAEIVAAGLCREQAPAAWVDSVEREIADTPFSE